MTPPQGALPNPRAQVAGRLLGGLIVVGAAVAVVVTLLQWSTRPQTDDATVRANFVGIAPQVSGHIVELRVRDNQPVHQGDVLFVVDPRPYEIALARARAALALTGKEVEGLRKGVSTADAGVAHAANLCGDDRRAGANLGAGGRRSARGSSREKAGCPGNAGGDARAASRDRGRTAAVQERTRPGGGRGRPGGGQERPPGRGGGRGPRRRARRRIYARPRAVQRPGRQSQYLDRRLRAERDRGVHARRYRDVVRDGELPGDAAASYSRGGARRPLPAITSGPAFPRHGRGARLGRAAGERDQRQWTAPRRALSRLDPAGGALPRAHQGREPGRILPHRGLGRRDRAWLA